MMKSVAPVPLSFNSFSNNQKPVFHTNAFHFLRDPDNSSITLQDLQKYDWTSNEQSAQEFLDCIVNFVTYNGCYIPACFQILVQGFIPKKSNKDAEFDLELSDRISHLIHGTLQKIITLIPLSLPLVGIALKDEFPHKRFSSEELFVYLKNLLLVSYYAPSLIDTLITTAVDHLIQIDVDIKLEDVPDTEELQFEVELEPATSELTARKLDSMMIVMFEFLDAAFGNCDDETRERTFPSMNLNPTHKQQLFNILLQIFDKYILTTYKSKYTQFILFYVCRLKPQEDNSFSARFMAYLFNKIQQKGNLNAHQMASAAYLGSFLARSNYVPASTLREVVAFIMNWTLSYLNTHPAGTPDAVVHGLFYSMSQSLYYIFCFRHEVLLSQGDVGALKKGYKRITESIFNPLKFCLPTIVREFVRICAENGWYDYTELVKSNEKLVLAKSTFGGANQLEMFFPFDPYLLKYSSKYLDAYYVSWSAPDDEDEDDEDEDDDEGGAFADDSSDSSDDDAGNADDDEEEGKESSDIEQLTNDFMHFTPDVERDISYHFSFD